MAAAVAELGRLDCVVANAAFVDGAPFHTMTTERYEAMQAVAQRGAFFTLREAVKHMRARAKAGDPGGSLILCGSLTGERGVPGLAHYGAAKGAGASGIMGGIPEDKLPMTAAIRAKNPIPRFGYPADLEGIAAYLMSDSSRFHTGDRIVIDGGQSVVVLS
jgi:NAD(P)-dependent dehydrogenase (short-subunit alcohol dehydrogenase family)